MSNENIDYAYNKSIIFLVLFTKFEFIKPNRDKNCISCDNAKKDAGFPDKKEIAPVAATN